MSRIRVFVFTYNRPALLTRALQSLLGQTFSDWVCELHNDQPEDAGPRALAKSIGDPRIELFDHAVNLGPTKTFNLAFSGANEEFVSILEDDNWWDPTFLEQMVRAMEMHPDVWVSWCNMRIWRQTAEGWVQSGDFTSPISAESPRIFQKMNWRQMIGAIHSNGAMLARSERIRKYRIPDDTLFDFIESVRERSFDYPIMYVPRILANFSLTVATARAARVGNWNAWQGFLRGSFLQFAPLSKRRREAIVRLAARRDKAPHHFVTTVILYPSLFCILRSLGVRGVAAGIAHYVCRPHRVFQTIIAVYRNRALKRFIDAATRANFSRSYQRRSA